MKSPEANVIKLPNISASVPQLRAAIKELQADGYALPEYPDEPKTDEEKDAKARYDSVKGSAVNPVLREGNSDRRAPKAVKAYAKRFPHSMGEWTPDSKTAVATMGADDFRANEQSVTLPAADVLTIEFTGEDGKTTVLKEGLKVLKGEVVDGTFMSAKALDAFLAEQVKRAKEEGILFSAHLKATMMKVSDPVIFGHVVKAYFSELFEKYGEQLMACVIMKDGVEPLTVDAVREFATGRIAHFKIPAYVRVLDAFPMTVSGKVRKVELRAEGAKLVEGGDRD